jgi:simple sugar transport system ATP-binding protein
MADELLRLTGIHKSFAGVRALQNVDLVVERGRIHCLVGENGCGKSTLIKIIAGVYQRDAGQLVINGKEFDRLHPIEAIRQGIQVIYQDFSLFPNLTVAENIALIDARDDLDQRGFAAAVLPDQAVDAASLDAQIDILQRVHASERFVDTGESQKFISHRSSPRAE